MWKQTLLSLLILSPYTLAETQNIVPKIVTEKSYTEQDVAELKQQWLAQWQLQHTQLEQQRENFLQAENLINTAIKHKNVSENLLDIAQKLFSPNYPLQEESQWLILRAKIAMANAENLDTLVNEIKTFSEKYPNTAKRNKLSQLPISLYIQYQKNAELLKYIANIPAVGIENQCRVFEAKWQQIQQQLNSEQADTAKIEQSKLLQEFDRFWQESTSPLSAECQNMEVLWQQSDFDNPRKRKLKAIALFEANAKGLLSQFVENEKDPDLNLWLNAINKLLNSPADLPNFAENQPLDHWNKNIVIKSFPTFIKTQPEQINQSHWAVYQQWAEKFQLNDEEQRQWKIAFLNRAFDNHESEFQAWRDSQLISLKADNLLERRIRMAIWQKTDLNQWLTLLSSEAQNKQEWRYWAAKSSTNKTKLLEVLSQERGFYPMLAANALGKSYHFDFPQVTPLNEKQLTQLQPQLVRIAELRALQRFDRAKLAWHDLLQTSDFEEKLAITHYAQQQNWFDLAVEGTIIAKAWDYIDLRLPNAYSDWFELNLQNKPVSKSFAMAIARQESAWNVQAKSHANAIGLMQMLPSTAKQTAENSRLPFNGENDLLQPFRNIMLGTAHLTELNQKYPDNRILIAAAYNAGSHRVDRWLKRSEGKLSMDEFIASIPFYETRGYVQNVLAYDYYYQMLQGKTPLQFFSTAEQARY